MSGENALTYLLKTLAEFGLCVLMLQIDPVLVIESDTISAPGVIDLDLENIEKEVETETAIVKEKRKGNDSMKLLYRLCYLLISSKYQ